MQLGKRAKHGSRQRLELRLDAFAQRVTIDVQQHGDELVPAHGAHDVHHAPFADRLHGGLERRVAHLVSLENLGTEVVDGMLLRLSRAALKFTAQSTALRNMRSLEFF
jgi:hypothetical protein